MKTNEIISVEVKDLNITKFIKKKDKQVVIQLKHFSNYQQKQISGLKSTGQKYNPVTNQIEIANRESVAEAFLLEMEWGVVKSTCPFEEWNKEYIKELDDTNYAMIAFIHNAIMEMNPPLAEGKKTK